MRCHVMMSDIKQATMYEATHHGTSGRQTYAIFSNHTSVVSCDIDPAKLQIVAACASQALLDASRHGP